MSSTGTALFNMNSMTRRDLEEAFCKNLSDDGLRIAIGSNFDAQLLWTQRDHCIDKLASHGLSIYEA